VKCLDAFRQRMDRADVIMVSHDYETMRAYCDLGAVLSGGGLMLFDDLEAAIEHHARAMRKSPISAMEFS
jgi:capsular polysaccharide transport system ATP-binding protein